MAQPGNSPADSPPRDALSKARAIAQRLGRGRSVYLYRAGKDWSIARRPAEIPAGAPAVQIFADPDHPELGNKGGC